VAGRVFLGFLVVSRAPVFIVWKPCGDEKVLGEAERHQCF